MTQVITVGNFKGGVGKSTVTEIFSYLLSEKYNKKVLVVDTDPQQNCTEKIRRTFNCDDEPVKQFMDSITSFDLKPSIVKVTENLDIIPGDWEIENFNDFVVGQDIKAKYYLLNTLLNEIKDAYDYVLIDTRPSTDKMNNNAICASDYVMIVAKTERDSLTSTSKYYEYLAYMNQYNPELRFVGALQYLVNTRGSTDKQIMNYFSELFEEDVFNSIIKSSERVKTWGNTGITTHRPHDKKTLQMYDTALIEMLERVNRGVEHV